MVRHGLIPAALLLAVSAVTATARAADSPPSSEPAPDAKETAKQRYQRGAAAYAEGRYTDAIDAFLDADRAAPNPAFAYNIGLAYEQIGDVPNALRWYRAYLRELPNAPDRADIEPRVLDAEKRLRAQGVQQITVLTDPSGATVSVDGQREGMSPWTGELAPGRHAIVLELHGFAMVSETFELPSDHAIDFSETMKAAAAPVTPVAAPALATRPVYAEPSSHRRVGPLTWTAFGVAVAGFGAALAFDLGRSGELDDARKSPTNLAGKSHYDQASTDATLSGVTFGVGAAFAVAGGALLYLDLTARPKNPRTGLAASCTSAFCGMTLHGAL
jgi:tetratricopeptide (TPR) repeat protein